MKTKSVILKEFKQLLELKYSGRTPENYLYHVTQFLNYVDCAPLRVNNEHILNYNLHIRHKGNSYRNVAINAIKAYFKLYLRKKVKGFSSIRPPHQVKKPVVYNCEALKCAILAIDNLKHRAILAIALCCWLRKSELLNLKVSDINGRQQTVHIKNAKGNKDRVVPITESTLEILRAYYKAFKPILYLFEGQTGGKYAASSVDKLVKKYLDKNMRFHQLRASGATYAVAMGTDIKTVSNLLGHAKIQTTEYYIPVLPKTVKQAI